MRVAKPFAVKVLRGLGGTFSKVPPRKIASQRPF